VTLAFKHRSQAAGQQQAAGRSGLAALVAIGVGGMVGGGIFSVLG